MVKGNQQGMYSTQRSKNEKLQPCLGTTVEGRDANEKTVTDIIDFIVIVAFCKDLDPVWGSTAGGGPGGNYIA